MSYEELINHASIQALVLLAGAAVLPATGAAVLPAGAAVVTASVSAAVVTSVTVVAGSAVVVVPEASVTVVAVGGRVVTGSVEDTWTYMIIMPMKMIAKQCMFISDNFD